MLQSMSLQKLDMTYQLNNEERRVNRQGVISATMYELL